MNALSAVALSPQHACLARAQRIGRVPSSRLALGAWRNQSCASLCKGGRLRGAGRKAFDTRADRDYGEDTYTEVLLEALAPLLLLCLLSRRRLGTRP